MDTLKKLITGLFALFCFTDAYAYTATGTDVYPNLKMIDGELHIQRPGGVSSILYPDIFQQQDVPVNTSKGRFLIPVNKPLTIDNAKVGKAAMRFVRTLPAIGTALAIYDTVCDLTSVCRNTDGSGFTASGLTDGYPGTTSEGYYKSAGGGNFTGPTQESVCTNPGVPAYYFPDFTVTYVNFVYPNCRFQRAVYNDIYAVQVSRVLAGCSDGYTLVSGQCVYSGQPVPATESDFTKAETTLNSQPQQVAESLYTSDAPVPVSPGTSISPVTQTIGTATTQVRDSGGNVTGTQTTTTTVTITDNSTTTNIEYNITEKVLVEDFDANNQPTGTKETQVDNEPPKDKEPPEDIKIENGNVDEVPLLTQTINVQDELDNAQQAEWSVYGSCPSDIDLGVYGLEFSLAPFCTFAENMRPIVLMLGAFFSFFILSGAKFN